MSRILRTILPILPILPILLVTLTVACASSWPEGSSLARSARREWRPSPAGLGDWVWIRLDTDEWLKGRIIVLRSDSLQFESDNLGKLTIDWDDVTEVYSKRSNDFLFGEGEEVTGAVSIVDNVVTITEYRGKQHKFPRNELKSIVPAGQKEIDHWSGRVSMGAGYRSGNTDQVDGYGDIDIARRSLDTRFTFGYQGNYSRANDEVNVNSQRLTTKFDYFLTWRLFLTLAQLEVYRDPIVNIRWQTTPGVGAGYTLMDQPYFMWDVSTGVGYRYTQYESVQPGEERAVGQTAFQFATNLEYDITRDLDLEVDYSLTVDVPSTGQWRSHFQARFSFDVTDDIDFDVTLTWDRNDTSVLDEKGETPEAHDIYVTLGLGIDF